MKRLILIIVFIVFGTISSFGQPGNGGGNVGGPPTPPGGYCNQNPTDPICNSSIAIGDWKWELGLILLGIGFIYYKFKKTNNYGVE